MYASYFQEYHQNLTETISGIHPSRIFNYDETNFRDDPKEEHVIVQKGLFKRIEKKIEHSKQAFRSVQLKLFTTTIYIIFVFNLFPG